MARVRKSRSLIGKVRLVLAVAFLAFFSGWIVHAVQTAIALPEIHWEIGDAMPSWTNGCVAPDASERILYEHALTSLELTRGTDVRWLAIGAKRFLSSGVHRRDGDKYMSVCPPEGLYGRVSDIITQHAQLQHRLVEYELTLLAKLPHRSDYIVNAVGASAFSEHPQQSDMFRDKDIRPLARTVLASFGKQASAYSKQAYEQMSATDSLGTGAAQIAVATGHPDALPRIQTMMNEVLSAIPKGKVVPWHTKRRLYELAYAISLAGDEARKHTGPIRELMIRKVQSFARPFGMLDLRPKRLCRTLQEIEGAEAVADYAFCTDDKVPLDS